MAWSLDERIVGQEDLPKVPSCEGRPPLLLLHFQAPELECSSKGTSETNEACNAEPGDQHEVPRPNPKLDFTLMLRPPPGKPFSLSRVISKVMAQLKCEQIESSFVDMAYPKELKRYDRIVDDALETTELRKAYYAKLRELISKAADSVIKMRRQCLKELDRLREEVHRLRVQQNLGVPVVNDHVAYFSAEDFVPPSWDEIMAALDELRGSRLEQEAATDNCERKKAREEKHEFDSISRVLRLQRKRKDAKGKEAVVSLMEQAAQTDIIAVHEDLRVDCGLEQSPASRHQPRGSFGSCAGSSPRASSRPSSGHVSARSGQANPAAARMLPSRSMRPRPKPLDAEGESPEARRYSDAGPAGFMGARQHTTPGQGMTPMRPWNAPLLPSEKAPSPKSGASTSRAVPASPMRSRPPFTVPNVGGASRTPVLSSVTASMRYAVAGMQKGAAQGAGHVPQSPCQRLSPCQHMSPPLLSPSALLQATAEESVPQTPLERFLGCAAATLQTQADPAVPRSSSVAVQWSPQGTLLQSLGGIGQAAPPLSLPGVADAGHRRGAGDAKTADASLERGPRRASSPPTNPVSDRGGGKAGQGAKTSGRRSSAASVPERGRASSTAGNARGSGDGSASTSKEPAVGTGGRGRRPEKAAAASAGASAASVEAISSASTASSAAAVSAPTRDSLEGRAGVGVGIHGASIESHNEDASTGETTWRTLSSEVAMRCETMSAVDTEVEHAHSDNEEGALERDIGEHLGADGGAASAEAEGQFVSIGDLASDPDDCFSRGATHNGTRSSSVCTRQGAEGWVHRFTSRRQTVTLTSELCPESSPPRPATSDVRGNVVKPTCMNFPSPTNSRRVIHRPCRTNFPHSIASPPPASRAQSNASRNESRSEARRHSSSLPTAGLAAMTMAASGAINIKTLF